MTYALIVPLKKQLIVTLRIQGQFWTVWKVSISNYPNRYCVHMNRCGVSVCLSVCSGHLTGVLYSGDNIGDCYNYLYYSIMKDKEEKIEKDQWHTSSVSEA